MEDGPVFAHLSWSSIPAVHGFLKPSTAQERVDLEEDDIAAHRGQVHIPGVSTITEIQQAIDRLPAREKKALSVWLSSQQEPEMSARDEAALLASLDKAAGQLDAGSGVPIDQVRGMVRRWASK